jgi:hypothetical protein
MHTHFTVRNIVQDTQFCKLDGFVTGVTCFFEKQHYRPVFAKMNVSPYGNREINEE